MENKALPETVRFIQVVSELRAKCPWDKKQTHQSLAQYLVEETYECLEAIDSGDLSVLEEELGDLLLQIALHAEIASEQGEAGFDLESVSKRVADKMIARHPHVYGEVEVKDDAEVKANWVKLKQQEKPDRKLLDGIPKALPGLLLAHKYGYRAATVGFDWPDSAGVLAKVREEVGELSEALDGGDKSAVEEEFGDLLFSLAQLGRHLKLDAEASLRSACQKFARRLQHVEESLATEGKAFEDCDLETLEAFWQRAKKQD
ncbi:MAG: nucleoside triphosphate pyrophosphohydrolase [Bdellovibrionaceae bacterium]|nr:nucleoside triphosphate pyrophosphohydrolase [Pseudobdellovibrionaceae bacterium]